MFEVTQHATAGCVLVDSVCKHLAGAEDPALFTDSLTPHELQVNFTFTLGAALCHLAVPSTSRGKLAHWERS